MAMDFGQQAPRSVELAVNKCRVEDQLRLGIGDLRLAPLLDLALHRFEVPLDPVHSNGKSVNQIEALAVHGQDRSEQAFKAIK
jgi:hypothetical protein